MRAYLTTAALGAFSPVSRDLDVEYAVVDDFQALVDASRRYLPPDDLTMAAVHVGEDELPHGWVARLRAAWGATVAVVAVVDPTQSATLSGDDPDAVVVHVGDLGVLAAQWRTALRAVGCAERRLDAARASWFEQVVATSIDGIFVADPNGHYVFANPAGLEMLGYTLDELRELTLRDLLGPQQIAREPLRLDAIKAGERFRVERTLLGKDGRRAEVEIAASLLPGGYLLGVAREVSAQRTATRALRESEERFRLLAEAAFDGVLIHRHGVILQANDAACRTLGYARDELVGRSIFDLIVPSDRDRLHGLVDKEVTEPYEIEVLHASGRTLCLEVCARTARLDGQPVRIGAFRDVTAVHARRQARVAALAADARRKAQTDFLATVSHELRTPLNAVIGTAGLLLSTELSARQRQMVTTLRVSAETLLDLINDVLDFSKIEAGRLDVRDEPYNPYRLVHDVGVLFARRAHAQDLELCVECKLSPDLWLRGDQARVRQILTNLVDNAIKYTAQGQVTLKASRVNGAQVLFSVADTGDGIAPDVAERIFEPFERLRSASPNAPAGTGLGLAISRRIAELLGGTLALAATSSTGSRFELTLPARPCAPPEGLAEGNGRCGRHLVLLVVDEVGVAAPPLKRALLRFDVEVRVAAAIPEGCAALRHAGDAIAAALVVMPGDSRDFAAAVEPLRVAAGRPLPVVVAARSAGPGNEANAAELPPNTAILTRPLRPSAVFDTVMELIEGKAPSRAAPGGPQAAPPREARVLIVEDNPLNRDVVGWLLDALDLEHDAVSTGLDGVERACSGDYDLVLMDCQLPDIDGYEATRRIRARCPDAPHVPIVALTAEALEGTRDLALAAGMDDYLSKPVTLEQLSAVVHRWVFSARLPE